MVRVYPIIEPKDVFDSPEIVNSLIRCGIKMLQLRGTSARDLLKAGRQIAASARAQGVSLIVNDRVDIAKLLGCGVHLGQEDLPPAEARGILGKSAIIGLSTHNEWEARFTSDADYISVGPVFPTSSKPDAQPVVGLEKLRDICQVISGDRINPVIVAVGGITFYNYRMCIDQGARYVAAIGAFRDDNGRLRDDTVEIARKMKY